MSSTSAVPSSLNENYAFTAYNKNSLVATGIIFMILPVLFVGLRFYARSISSIKLGIDDWMMIPAIIITIANGVVQILAAELGSMGSHQRLGPDGDLIHTPELYTYEKTKYTLQLLGPFNLAVIKLSILLLYRRIFYTGAYKTFKTINNIVIGVNIAWGLAFVFALAFQCKPPSNFWTKFELEYTAYCVDVQSLYLASGISDLILDIIVISLPIPLILRLQMPNKDKLAVAGMFLLSSVVLASGIAKLITFYQVVAFTMTYPTIYFKDTTWFESGTLFWTFIENAVAIIAACLPTLRPLFVKIKRNTRARGSSSSSYGRAYSGYSRKRSIWHWKLNSEVGTEQAGLGNQIAPGHSNETDTERIALNERLPENRIRVQRDFYAGPPEQI